MFPEEADDGDKDHVVQKDHLVRVMHKIIIWWQATMTLIPVCMVYRYFCHTSARTHPVLPNHRTCLGIQEGHPPVDRTYFALSRRGRPIFQSTPSSFWLLSIFSASRPDGSSVSPPFPSPSPVPIGIPTPSSPATLRLPSPDLPMRIKRGPPLLRPPRRNAPPGPVGMEGLPPCGVRFYCPAPPTTGGSASTPYGIESMSLLSWSRA
jgi:hypothetical protein